MIGMRLVFLSTSDSSDIRSQFPAQQSKNKQSAISHGLKKCMRTTLDQSMQVLESSLKTTTQP
jgi:hypothetical protein